MDVPLDVDRIRADFPILSTTVHGKPLTYLDNAATTQRPSQVIESLKEIYEHTYANVHRGIHWLSEQSTDLYEQARARVQQMINAARSHEVIFTTGATMAINLVARSWGDTNVSSGDEILLTEMEHHSNMVPWQQLAQRTGCRIRFLPLTDDGELDLSALDTMLNERTRLFAWTAVSNVLGTINPVGELVERAAQVGAATLVDAAQCAPHEPLDVQQWGADFVAFSGHKMMGPSGVGVLYGKERMLEAMPPFLGGGSMIEEVTTDGFKPGELPQKFEAGTPPIVQALGLRVAIDYLSDIGLQNVLRHERALTAQAHQALESIGGVRIFGPPPHRKAGIVSFVVEGIHAHDVAHLADRQGVAVRAGHHCAMPLHERLGVAASTRASFYFYNTPQEVERLAEAIVRCKRVFRRA